MKKAFYFYLPVFIAFVLFWSFSITVHAGGIIVPVVTATDDEITVESATELGTLLLCFYHPQDTFTRMYEYDYSGIPVTKSAAQMNADYGFAVTNGNTVELWGGGETGVADCEAYNVNAANNPGQHYYTFEYNDGVFTQTYPAGEEPPTTTGSNTATSSVDQTQQNTYNFFVVFLATFFGTIWLFRKKG